VRNHQDDLPKDVFPGVALDWEEFSAVHASAWRMSVTRSLPCKRRQSAAAKRTP
jgi:hypothetical protein